ncbi:unnamed protein product [Ilex paraguariensis]
MELRSDQIRKVGFYEDDYYEYKTPSKVPLNNWVQTNDHDLSMIRPEYVSSVGENEFEKIRPPVGSLRSGGDDSDLNLNRPEYGKSSVEHELEEIGVPTRSLKSRPIVDQWSMGRSGSMAFHGNARGFAEHGKFASCPYPEEGPSNYPPCPGSFYGHGAQLRNRDGHAGLARVEDLENDRAELLRKLDELKDQLGRSCDVAEKRKERVAVDRRMAPPPPDPYEGHGAFIPEGSTNLYSVDMQPVARDTYVPTPYIDHNRGPLPYTSSHGLDMQEFYAPSKNFPYEFLGYEDAYRPQMPRRTPHQPPRQYLQVPSHDRLPSRYTDQDTLVSRPHETFYHQAACSCLHCSYRNWQMPPKVPPPVFNGQRLRSDSADPIFYPRVNHMYDPHGYNSEYSNPPQLHTWDQQPHTRGSSDLDLNNGGFGLRHPRRVVVARGSEQVWHPVAGGAPLVTCCNCFELLKLPRKLMVVGKNPRKMRCGACSSIILFEFQNKGLVVSVPAQIKQVSAQVDDASNETQNHNLQSSHDCSNAGATNSISNDYNNCRYNFQLTTEPSLLLRDQRSNLSEAEKKQGPHSSSSSFSEDKQSPDCMIVRKDVSHSAELPLLDSPLQEQPDYSSSSNVVSRYEKRSKSLRIDQEKVILDRTTSRQNSVKDAPVATEMDVSFNDILNSGVSQESLEISKEDDRPRINKGGESFFAGLIKKSFGDFSRSSQSHQNGRSNVYVNGQLIPDRVVKKAEKLAGPIQPGEYWYDFRAGFWGLISHPCLGIIPPRIEEFNYPMPENCSAGNTGVFVNGRELHQKDLDLLAGRGLPITKHKSFLIEISGRVLDEHTGEELDSLGKLAPTVEKVKHGFGMKVPKAVA